MVQFLLEARQMMVGEEIERSADSLAHWLSEFPPTVSSQCVPLSDSVIWAVISHMSGAYFDSCWSPAVKVTCSGALYEQQLHVGTVSSSVATCVAFT